MNSTTDTKSSFVTKFTEFEAGLNGSAQGPWHAKRKAAMQLFEQMGFPPARTEEYKYTNIAKALDKNIGQHTGSTPSSLTAADIEQFMFKGLEANQLVFINGQYRADLSRVIASPDQLLIQELSGAYEEQPEKIAEAMSRLAKPEDDSFIALNTAFAQHGLFIEAPAKAVVEHPVIIHYISDSSQAVTTSQPRNLFLIGRSAELSIVEVYNSVGDNSSFTNLVSEVDVEENAQLQYFKLQTENDHALQVNTTNIYQRANSNVTTTTITLGGGLVRNNLNFVQDASNCESHMYGLYYLHGNQHVDNHTTVDHRQPHSMSNELYKGIMDDRSTGVFNGKIFVRQAAQKTNAFQSNKNILLSDNATINTKPQLEIWADDVKCSHGATTGQIDEEQVFYLRSRGLSEASARALLLHAFAADIIEHISIEPVKEHFLDVLSGKLNTKY